MLTVRFPNGQAVQYNGANFLYHGNNQSFELYTKSKESGGTCVAIIPSSAGALVEFVVPCRVYDGMEMVTGQQIRDIKSSLATIKRKLPAVKKHHK
jgi:hypothetical protein